MHYFFDNLDSLHQLTLNLDAHPDRFRCLRCRQSDQFVSHGFVYKKQHQGQRRAVGKRLFCANRYARSGCGATLRLSLADTLPRLQYAAAQLQTFVFVLIAGATVADAYCHATGAASSRHAWRWLTKLQHRLGDFRTWLGRRDHNGAPFVRRCRRLRLLLPTLALCTQIGVAFVSSYQSHRQQPFLG